MKNYTCEHEVSSMFPVKQGDNQQTVYCLCLFVVWWFQIFFLVLLICPTGTNFCCRENKAFIFDSQRGVAYFH